MTYEGLYQSSNFGRVTVYSVDVTNVEDMDHIIFSGKYNNSNDRSQTNAYSISKSDAVGKVFYASTNTGQTNTIDCSYQDFSSWTYITR